MKKQLAFFLLLVLATGCARESLQTEKTIEEKTEQDPVETSSQEGTAQLYLNDDLTALVEESLAGGSYRATKSVLFNDLVESLGITSMERVFPDAGEYEARHRAFGLHKWYRITFNKDIPVTKAGDSALQIPGIEIWEPVRKVRDNSFNDPQLSNQWHYKNDGGSNRKAGADINVFPVWDNYTTGSSDVLVGVVDSGVDNSHEDLEGQVLTDRSRNFARNSSVIYPGDHGTHVGGTIAAINNNGKGVAGIAGGDAKAGNSGVKIVSCQIFDGESSVNGADAIIWAADHGAVVCNNSWGLDYSQIEDSGKRAAQAKEDHDFFLQPNAYPYKHTMKDAIDYFNANAGMDKATGTQTGPMAGGVVFFSAGNDPWQYGGYAAYPGVMAVGAIGPTGDIAYYSSYGDWVDICAPGGDLNFGNPGGVLSTLPDNSYGYYQGTSMACPHVTGVAALVVSYCGKAGFTRQMLWDRLIGGAKADFIPAGRKIGPLVNALGAITYGEDHTPAAVASVTTSVHSNFSDLSWKVTGDGTVPAYGYRLFYGPDRAAVEASSPDKTEAGVVSLMRETSGLKVGETMALNLEDLDFETTYYGKVYGYDYSLNYSAPTAIFTFTTGANSAPQFTAEGNTDNILIHAFETTRVNFTVSDPEGHSFTVEHEKGSNAETLTQVSGVYTLTIVGKNGALGTHTATITATDSFGKASELVITYTIVNEAPEVVKPIENMLFNDIGEESSVNLAEYVSDPDGEVLTYTVSNTAPAVIHFNVSKGVMHVTALGTGLAEVTVTGTDALGEKVNFTFKALVRNSKYECSAYPNPVSSTLYISNAESETVSMSIVITSSSGGKVYEGTQEVSAFEPASVDMSGVAPGRYSASMTYNGNTYKQTVIKK